MFSESSMAPMSLGSFRVASLCSEPLVNKKEGEVWSRSGSLNALWGEDNIALAQRTNYSVERSF